MQRDFGSLVGITTQARADRAILDLHKISLGRQKRKWLPQERTQELGNHIGQIQRIFDLAIPKSTAISISEAALPDEIFEGTPNAPLVVDPATGKVHG